MANAHAKSLVDMQRVTDASRAEHEAEIAKLKQTHESEQAEMRKHARDEHEAEIVKLKQTYESEQAEIQTREKRKMQAVVVQHSAKL